MMASKIDIVLPTNGVKMPALGFGTWQATDAELEEALDNALKAGYRHIDTAYVYENEGAIGRVLSRWISSGKITREELFVVTKLPPGGNRPESVEKYIKKSLSNLQLDYLDLYLIHTPIAFVDSEDAHPHNDKGEILLDTNTDHVAVWKAMEEQVKAGRAKAIGLSNFNIKQIERILKSAKVRPANLQIELHLYFQQKELVEFCKTNNITVTAYSPLGSRGIVDLFKKLGHEKTVPDILDNEVVKSVAKKHGKTPGQILLRFIVQNGIAAIPKSTNLERMKQNISIFDFSLDENDLKSLRSQDKGEAARICDLKFLKGVEKHPEFPF